MRCRVGRGLVNTAYGSFLILYLYAAAAYGLTREAPLAWFEAGMLATLVLWGVGHGLLGTWPAVGRWPLALGVLALAYGWFVTGVGAVNEALLDDRLPTWESWFPDTLRNSWASYVPELSVAAMTRTSALIAAFWIAIALWRRPTWARALILTMVVTASGMVLLFLLQRLVGGPFLLDSVQANVKLAFATYRYHGNAAAFLNLFWPICLAIAAFAALRRSAGWPLWFFPAALVFLANFLNVSKAGNVLAFVGLIFFALLLIPVVRHEFRRARKTPKTSHLIAALVPLVIIIASLPFALPWGRWEYFAQTAESGADGSRLAAYQVFVQMLPESSWGGFGPGTFQQIYRQYVEGNRALENQAYWTAHQDYIQTLVEWGYAGTAIWGLLLCGGIVPLARLAFRKTERPSREFEGYRIGLADHVRAFLATTPGPQEPVFASGALVAVILTALHALVDFPMQIASIQLFFLTLVALGWSQPPRERASRQPASSEEDEND